MCHYNSMRITVKKLSIMAVSQPFIMHIMSKMCAFFDYGVKNNLIMMHISRLLVRFKLHPVLVCHSTSI
jgi:hypothetical protein